MTLERSDIADKFVVDRRKPVRNSDVAKTVRRTRERLSQQRAELDFDEELVKVHANAVSANIGAVPILTVLLGLAAVFSGNSLYFLIWPLMTAFCYLPLALIARRYGQKEPADIDAKVASRDFLLAHFVSGLGWTYLAMQRCGACAPEQDVLLQVVVMLIVIGATALVASALRGATLVTFTMPVLVFGAVSIMKANPTGLVLFALLVVALIFLTYVSSKMQRSQLMSMAFRSEKDELIAELETAKSMSDEARYRAEEANLAKSRFLASMSHELRTPLNAILGFSEVMSNEVLGPMANGTYRDYARDIHESGSHLLDLINEILDLSRIEAGRYQLNEEPVNIAHVVDECCHMMELRAHKKDIRIIQQVEPDMPKILADERSVRQIVLNLMANAIKFSSTGSEVRVRAGWTAGGGQYISVKDNGPGIPENEIPVVLSAFGQGAIAIKSAEQGTGLGLPIVQGLLSVHGGEFQLKSKLREGTEAFAIFPPSRVMEIMPALPTRYASRGRR